MLVERAPASRASILGALLSLRMVGCIRQTFAAFISASTDGPSPEHPADVVHDQRSVLFGIKCSYEARARLTIAELSGLLEVDEPDSCFDHELARWRSMLHDYARALDPQLHERIEAVTDHCAAPTTMEQTWVELGRLRQLDACAGLLLARAAMLDPRPGLLGLVDPTSTRAHGSVAWWCRWLADVWECKLALGERLHPKEIERVVEFARIVLEQRDAELLSRMSHAFPQLTFF
jgi:hypothetical protein